MHLAQRLIHLFQPLADLRKAVVQSLFQRAVQLFVHRLAHFFQLTAVFVGKALHAFVQGAAQGLHTGVVALQQAVELVTLHFQYVGQKGDLAVAGALHGLGQFPPLGRALLQQVVLHAFQPLPELLLKAAKLLPLPALTMHHQRDQHHSQHDQNQRQSA